GARQQLLRAAMVGSRPPDEVRAALLQWFDPVVLPRTIRVFDGLPRTATGKLRRDALRQLFDGPDEIEVVDREVDGDTVQATLMVPEGLPAFDGHFPDHPVLP